MIEIKIDNQTAMTGAFRRLAATAGNLRPALDDIGERLAESTKRRFSTSTAPSGKHWKKNRPSTLARKKNPLPLVRLGDLQDTIHYRASGQRLEVGSPMIYAAAQQFGARRGAFGKTRHGVPIPWGDIPARPFLGISRQDSSNILDILADHLKNSLARG